MTAGMQARCHKEPDGMSLSRAFRCRRRKTTLLEAQRRGAMVGESAKIRIAIERGPQLRRPYLRGPFSSFDKSDRNSASARFPANWAAISDWNPSAVILMPNGLLLRH